ncbi:gluconate 2-dehydrogenase, cytochrome c subunit [Neokomagataea thailandica NBRC 106555]|uniref:Alcohol dehydrogenase n=2 Tax=Neokomagataea TaxID=1223423 RepID=A0A4Y6V501_9PROT|nr:MULTISPECIES: cytochrome c [Neokomagataea]QDH24424.1 alcohol dehydrogenase [Neokomagataea tanensis]GBR50850.1 gluconate 2-dehydrogenase, cytochrome c subunit [Neokomagataea thailandica NBRC 106555]
MSKRFFLSALALSTFGAGAFYISLSTPSHAEVESTPVQPDPSLIEEGRYVAAASDCSACHTVHGKEEYTGGMPFALPMGTIHSTNITPDREHGIGNYSEADFARAIRYGIRKDGSTLYPAMPYPSYARMTDKDMHALYVYFHYGVKASSEQPPRNTIPWPLSMRWPLVFWRTIFSPSPAKVLDTTKPLVDDPVLARGAYLVEGPGHCGACHSPRGLAMQEKALTAQDGDAYLSGGAAVDGWIPPSLRADDRTGLARWSEDDIATFLATGRNKKGSAFGSMTPAIMHGTQNLSPEDLHAIAHYLHHLGPSRLAEKPWVYDPKVANDLKQGHATARGAMLYINNCAACHKTDGSGYPDVFPPLAGNPVVMTKDPASLVHIVQSGATLPAMHKAPSALTMPSFEGHLSDQEIADVVTFIRQSWGNDAAPVSRRDVEKLKKTMPPRNLSEGPIPQN